MTAQLSELREAREKLEAKQDELAAIFDEARDGEELNFSKVESIEGGPQAVADEVKRRNEELNELGENVEALVEAQQAAEDQKRRERLLEEPVQQGPHPENGKGAEQRTQKSLGQMITETKRYQEYAKRGVPGGIDFSFKDVLPSDLMAGAALPNTMGTKTLFQTSAGWAPESVRIPGLVVDAVTRPIQLLDIVPLAQTDSAQIVYMEETTRTHAAAETAEGATYPEAEFALTEQTSNVRKIATSIPVTDEQLEDVAQAESYLSGRLIFGLRQRLDEQVLTGSGTGVNLEGIANNGSIQTQALGSDPVPDAFFKAMQNIRVTGRAMPTHHIIHPDDWEDIRLLRTADGIYIWGNPSEAGPERMFGLPVVQADAGSAGTGYVGSFMPAWISLFEKRGVDVQVGYVDTQFTEGERTIRADMRMAFVLFRPAAFCQVTGI